MEPEIKAPVRDAKEPLFSLYTLAYLGIFAAGLLLRWLELDARPVHHDESLHTMYGRYFFDFPDHNYYRYQAMLHGPVLYNVLRVIYNTLGSSTWAARALPALLGSLLMFAPLLFRRYFSRNALLALTAALALSPTLIYWSRFIREDIPQLVAMFIMLYGAVLAQGGKKAFFVLFGLTLQFCIKENAFVTGAVLLGYLVYEAFFNHILLKGEDSTMRRIGRYIRRHWAESLCALTLCVLMYCVLYGAGFRADQIGLRHVKGILDGVYRDSIMYWLNQHNIERIPGPFLFHFYMLSWYELLFIVALFVQLYIFYRNASPAIQACGAAVLILAVGCTLSYAGRAVQGEWPWSFFKLKDQLDLLGLFIILFHPILLTTQHLLRRERALAFWGYLFGASFFTYSYLGEKVPWLAVYPFVPGVIYLALFFDDYFKRHPVSNAAQYPWSRLFMLCGSAVVIWAMVFMLQEGWKENWVFVFSGIVIFLLGLFDHFSKTFGSANLMRWAFAVLIVFNLRSAVLTNFVYAGQASEFISQVHTTHEFHDFVLRIHREIEAPVKGYKPLILGIEDVVWPITWYLVDIPEYKFSADEQQRKNFDYIFQNCKGNCADDNYVEAAPPGFRSLKLKLRGWWVPDYKQMTVKKFLHYTINRRPWSPSGFSYVTVLINTDRDLMSSAAQPG